MRGYAGIRVSQRRAGIVTPGPEKVSQTAQIFVRARSVILLYSSPQDRLTCAQLFLLRSREHYAPERFTTFGENQQSGPLFQPD